MTAAAPTAYGLARLVALLALLGLLVLIAGAVIGAAQRAIAGA